jgi:hypothetical protein
MRRTWQKNSDGNLSATAQSIQGRRMVIRGLRPNAERWIASAVRESKVTASNSLKNDTFCV